MVFANHYPRFFPTIYAYLQNFSHRTNFMLPNIKACLPFQLWSFSFSSLKLHCTPSCLISSIPVLFIFISSVAPHAPFHFSIVFNFIFKLVLHPILPSNFSHFHLWHWPTSPLVSLPYLHIVFILIFETVRHPILSPSFPINLHHWSFPWVSWFGPVTKFRCIVCCTKFSNLVDDLLLIHPHNELGLWYPVAPNFSVNQSKLLVFGIRFPCKHQ